MTASLLRTAAATEYGILHAVRHLLKLQLNQFYLYTTSLTTRLFCMHLDTIELCTTIYLDDQIRLN